MTFNWTKSITLLGATLGSLMFGVLAIPRSVSAQGIQQMPSPTGVIVTPSNTRAVLPLSQIRVADLPTWPRNPCPRIYYQPPFNQRIVVPQTCPANQVTQQLGNAGLLPIVRQQETQNEMRMPGSMGSPYSNSPTPMVPSPAY